MTHNGFFINMLPELLLPVAEEAGKVIMGYYKTGHVVDSKADKSPVTEADRKADILIVNALKSLNFGFPIVSEEGDKPDVSGADYFWLVDPLDGTKSFIRGHGYFTVNIGLIKQGKPVFGIIYDPANDIMYWGLEGKAYRKHDGITQAIHVRPAPGKPVAIVSHSHLNPVTEAFLTSHNITERIACASSIKFCFLAEGKADIYPRFGPTMEWDTAAGHAIFSAAGGTVVNSDGSPFNYGKPEFLNGNFVAKN
jgi:3'(2'), 5'-bisphosphate nucleotidase